MEEKLYFAYGSNINLDQMAVRCPAARVAGPVVLDGYELLFRGNAGGNGVATIAPHPGHRVHGLLWKITPDCERSLDRYEGYPHLYGKEPVNVVGMSGRKITVMAYVMTGGSGGEIRQCHPNPTTRASRRATVRPVCRWPP